MIGETWIVEYLHAGQWHEWARVGYPGMADVIATRVCGDVVRVEWAPRQFPNGPRQIIRASATRIRQAA